MKIPWELILTSSLISSIISGLFLTLNNYVTNKKNFKISEQKINADLQSQSRINWVQDVRMVTVDLISSHYDLMESCESGNKTDMLASLKQVQYRTELFSFYFASVGKSDLEFNLQDECPSAFNVLSSFMSEDEKKKRRKNTKEKMENAETKNKSAESFIQNQKSNDGKKFLLTNLAQQLLILQAVNIQIQRIYDKDRNNNSNGVRDERIRIFDKYLLLFQESTSLYLAIEWNRAKDNKV